MKKKKFIIISLLALFILFGFIIYLRRNTVPNNYIAVFNGGSGEVTYSTYIYKIKNDHANYGFEYINTTNTTISWGNSKIKRKITKRGKVDWTDDVFKVAKDNNAYEYVTTSDGSKLSIDDFMSRFLMN